MPLYTYSCSDCGKTTEVVGTMQAPQPATTQCQCGKDAGRDIGADWRTSRGKLGDVWPIVSDGAAISADMISAYQEFDRKHGVVTEYKPDGRPVLTSRGHRRDYFKAHKIFDRDGGYGDAQSPTFRTEPDDFV